MSFQQGCKCVRTHLNRKQVGSKAQAHLPTDDSPKLDEKGIKHIQQIVGSILYYARAVDMTVLAGLSTIAIDQTKATERTMKRCIQLLDYLASNQNAKKRYFTRQIW